jgi:hypothetical protein
LQGKKIVYLPYEGGVKKFRIRLKRMAKDELGAVKENLIYPNNQEDLRTAKNIDEFLDYLTSIKERYAGYIIIIDHLNALFDTFDDKRRDQWETQRVNTDKIAYWADENDGILIGTHHTRKEGTVMGKPKFPTPSIDDIKGLVGVGASVVIYFWRNKQAYNIEEAPYAHTCFLWFVKNRDSTESGMVKLNFNPKTRRFSEDACIL